MINSDAKRLAQMVKKAKEWTPEHESDKLLEETCKLLKRTSKENYDQIKVKKCCLECVFLNPNDTCENFKSPLFTSKRRQGEWIPIPRNLAESMYCNAWVENQLAKLLVIGYSPSGISHNRLHPQIKVPWNGLLRFFKYLRSQRHGKRLTKHKKASDSYGLKWPEMDSRLKEILMNVEQRGNKEMWSQYQGTLFLMGPINYVDPILDCLLQNPHSQIAPAETDALYYLQSSDGQIHTARIYKEHLKNIKKYLD